MDHDQSFTPQAGDIRTRAGLSLVHGDIRIRAGISSVPCSVLMRQTPQGAHPYHKPRVWGAPGRDLRYSDAARGQAGDIRTRAGTSSDHAPHSILVLFDHGICADYVLFLYKPNPGARLRNAHKRALARLVVWVVAESEA